VSVRKQARYPVPSFAEPRCHCLVLTPAQWGRRSAMVAVILKGAARLHAYEPVRERNGVPSLASL